MNRRQFLSLAAKLAAISPLKRFLPPTVLAAGAQNGTGQYSQGYISGKDARIWIDGQELAPGSVGSITVEAPPQEDLWFKPLSGPLFTTLTWEFIVDEETGEWCWDGPRKGVHNASV